MGRLRSFKAWSDEDIDRLKSMHGVFSLKQIADDMGRTAGSIRGMITRLGIKKLVLWTDAEVMRLVQIYEAAGPDGVVELDALAFEMGRDKANVCRKAKSLGLTNICRRIVRERKVKVNKYGSSEELRAAISKRMKKMIEERGHPRGMAGKKHSPEALEKISAASKATALAMSEDRKSEIVMKAMKTRHANGTDHRQVYQRGSWKAGWREIGGKRNYYRSMWEANYARYLEWLREGGHIADWKHEPEVFWFEAIKRGVRSYKPDFRVWENDGTSCLHEVKGWMDARSKTCLSRMKKYHPSEKVIVIDEKQYRAIRLKVMRLVSGWENSDRDSRL